MVMTIVTALTARYRTTLIARRVGDGVDGVCELVVTVIGFPVRSTHYMEIMPCSCSDAIYGISFTYQLSFCSYRSRITKSPAISLNNFLCSSVKYSFQPPVFPDLKV